jgi:hypothetical protein
MLYRNELSWRERTRRSLYECLRDELDKFLIDRSLIQSYKNFLRDGLEYPFAKKRELKPKAIITEKEYPQQAGFLVIFCEGHIPESYKKHIRFFDHNKVTKGNLGKMVDFNFSRSFRANLKYFESHSFFSLTADLLPVDYGLLIQQDPGIKTSNRYVLSHFHVRVDYPISEAAEAMGKNLRYLSRDLYENGERYAEYLQDKVFEYCAVHHTVSGRRTAAVVAHQLLNSLNFISTVYVASSEARTLLRLSELGLSKFVLLQLNSEDIQQITKQNKIGLKTLRENFFVREDKDGAVVLFKVVYARTPSSLPPPDGKLRYLNPNKAWLTIANQLLMPKPTSDNIRPVVFNTIYG